MTRTTDDGAGPHSVTQANRAGGEKKRRKTNADAIRKAEREATRIAARQWAALTSAQAKEAGFSRDQIAYRLETGRWRQPVRGV